MSLKLSDIQVRKWNIIIHFSGLRHIFLLRVLYFFILISFELPLFSDFWNVFCLLETYF